ncbi:hypothetical protein RFI_22288 [Reticulomyxa filosa]|uniref:Uncharacterized protein n=1 Tax=Reticulomyxa filosa TaxID=46433 RepID=X6MPQ2_RETFI|nr:hypothetical protein RFI_22288 [Reticulomyxa filosa]|eukprot:ETO15075.1 hypothetical protein RFI_22288 [Reticulomyxa filosa]
MTKGKKANTALDNECILTRGKKKGVNLTIFIFFKRYAMLNFEIWKNRKYDTNGENVYDIELDEKYLKVMRRFICRFVIEIEGIGGQMNKTKIQYLFFKKKKKTWTTTYLCKNTIEIEHMDVMDIFKKTWKIRTKERDICYIKIDVWIGESINVDVERTMHFNNNEKSDDKSLDWVRLEFTNGMVATIRFIGHHAFSQQTSKIRCEGCMYKGIHYFTCPPKRWVVCDPSLHNVKLQNPTGAYKSVSMVSGSLLSSWEQTQMRLVFPIPKCEQIDLCLGCMLKLHFVDILFLRF